MVHNFYNLSASEEFLSGDTAAMQTAYLHIHRGALLTNMHYATNGAPPQWLPQEAKKAPVRPKAYGGEGRYSRGNGGSNGDGKNKHKGVTPGMTNMNMYPVLQKFTQPVYTANAP